MKAYLVNKIEDKKFESGIQDIEIPSIEDNEVLIKVTYSSLNFKDALSSVGNPGVTRVFPHVTGIDVAGIIEESNSSKFNKGDIVLVTGYDMGMNTNGGHAQFVKVPASWVINMPENITDKEIMTYGTAGLTAALSVNELLNNGITSGEVLVTGATGGVGSIAVSILSKLGFNVTAISGKEDKVPFLKELGAKEVILRKDFDVENKKPMGSEKYNGVIDTVGGNILAEALKVIKYDGVATCCGLTSSFELNTNVFPFILRGVRLIGIDSVEAKLEKKIAAWEKIASDFKIDSLDNLTNEITLDEIKEAYEALLAGKAVGRYLVKL
ncbi:YhdH/YhfP family quinone oxidoreductase [Aliarcobacter butzleri]|uniref:YhdH/YhfP family quinone oxidoreductase n=4 Tax=Aliarcobacter butzleri TaxID=28197 RepID=A0AAW7PTY9_9BACT|nr:YhdH/YhfP family quinone oxidoreductase [Aliarcobacter butzleri]KLE02500.1 quinone oxidoreductase [Aliarcobacter butzleri L348]MCG3667804.1 YhdH/YhfP family quinone oxidoreductase [Aliarcobacter butzleri]MCG3713603.1 YhdH/YhfP family quinone oxidoreductase [Aliarcobacter butzleri]MCT7632965.1 YhdH/YhfP family quinone oxidoreductase [Aliarcobacter butzleri]MDN5069444.1 YhdH/YhfP family quinone oxidoreductase [Aliarcobacter butzleri]